MVAEVASVARRAALRRDLQGVRGLGIIFVVVGHLWRWPPGVFAMLDMFFVLSGFLITGILVESFERYGGRFFAVFYLSRFRRLMPAAVTVIVVTVGLWFLLINSASGHLVLQDGLWALALAVNWHFASGGTNYFASQHDSPLLHYWSLSVEEQFYAVWPLLVFLVVLASARRGRRGREVTLLGVLGLVTAGAFVYSVWHSTADPNTAYFSTFDRTWEFGVGALVAVLAPRLARLPLWAGAALGWGGVLGLVVTIWLLPYGVAFPAPYGLLPVLLTGAILAGGIDRDTSYLPVLDNRVMIYLGDTSYSIYLWHLPVNLLLYPYFTQHGAWYYTTALTLTMASALTCYYLIERPLRHATWLMTPPERLRARLRGARPEQARRLQLGWATLCLVVVSGLVALALRPTPSVSQSGSPQVEPTRHTAGRTTLVERQQQRLAAALEEPSFPAFDPPLSQLGLGNWARAADSHGCTDVSVAEVDSCRFGEAGATKVAAVVGDSYATAWMPAIRGALVPHGWAVQQLTYSACPSWALRSYVTPDGEPFPECADQHVLVDRYLAEDPPDLILVASGPGEVRNDERPGLPTDGSQLAYGGLTARLRALPRQSKVVVLAPPPGHADLERCVTRFGVPQSCTTQPDAEWYDHVDGETRAAGGGGAAYVQTRDWFCVMDSCPGFVGRTPVTADGSHLTSAFAASLAPLLRQALVQAGIR